MSEKLPFWQEIRTTLMLRGTTWQDAVESLPEKLNADEVQEMLQSVHQLANANMQGIAFLEGRPVTAAPDKDVLAPQLPAGKLTIENVTLQWLYQFFILEGLDRAMRETNPHAPMAEWPQMILDMFQRGLQFMVYMSALLCLMEEQSLELELPLSDFANTEQFVRSRVANTTKNLCRKSQDYGESFRRHGVAGLIPRLWDKIARYTQLKSESREPNFESMQDSVRDLLGYSAIAWSLVLEVPQVHNIYKVTIER